MGQDYKVGETRDEYVARRAIANQEAKDSVKGKLIHASVEYDYENDKRKTYQFESKGYQMVRQAMSQLRINKEDAMTLVKGAMKEHVMKELAT